jgi:hypothetical protein
VTAPPSDDELRQRLQELGRREAASAPRFDRVLRGRRPASGAMPAESRGAPWRTPAFALAGAALIAAVAWWWPMSPGAVRSVPIDAETAWSDPTVEWDLPTDGLAAETSDGAGGREVERLSRDIEGLLRR